ncbi:hypothetical protein ACFQY4_37315 [Catellatospora bangladeshensis]|uniref:hypothetical protein n=1 Tax=Catellatospora bangladeshensis TaxID=310355 RepID=UPI00360C144D
MIEDASPATRADTGTLLTAQLTGLEELVLQANKPGNLDGLLAHHILGARRLSVPWNVDPMSEQWMADNEHRLAHAHGLAVLGYGLTSFPSPAAQAARRHLAAGLPPLMRKNPFQTDGVTFVNDPAQIVGLALAVTAAHEDVPRRGPGSPTSCTTPACNPQTCCWASSRSTPARSSTPRPSSNPTSSAATTPSTSPACTGWLPRPRACP